jgi:hypothetical protein
MKNVFVTSTLGGDGPTAFQSVLDLSVGVAPVFGEELLVLLVRKTGELKSKESAGRILRLIAPGEGRDADFWKKWLSERKPSFQWSEEDCRFLPKNGRSGG